MFWLVADAALYCTFIFWGWFSHGFRAARVILLWDRDLPWWTVTWPDLLLFYFLFGLYCSFELFHVNLFSPSQYFLLTGNTVDRIPGATVPSCFSEHGGVGFPLLSNKRAWGKPHGNLNWHLLWEKRHEELISRLPPVNKLPQEATSLFKLQLHGILKGSLMMFILSHITDNLMIANLRECSLVYELILSLSPVMEVISVWNHCLLE